MNGKKLVRHALAAALIGCLWGITALAGDVTETDAPLDFSQMEPEEAVYTYLTEEMGLNSGAACGVMANIAYESGFDPTAWGDGGTSHGLCQWHNGRCDNLTRFCRENGYDVESVYGQMAFLQYELTNSYPSVLEHLMEAEDSPEGAYDAAWYWCYYFEVPADRGNVAVVRGNAAAEIYYPQYASGETVLPAEDAQDPEAAAAEDTEQTENGGSQHRSRKPVRKP